MISKKIKRIKELNEIHENKSNQNIDFVFSDDDSDKEFEDIIYSDDDPIGK